MSDSYLLITEPFAMINMGYQKDENVFNYGITLNGDYVCAANSLNEFPELFTDSPYLFGLVTIELTPEDFPQTPVF